MPEYTEVKWEKAACAGIEVEVFYRLEEIHYPDPEIYIKPLRALCATCPIWKDCLAYAAGHENYGWWGGMETDERRAFTKNGKESIRLAVYKELGEQGITQSMIDEALEAR